MPKKATRNPDLVHTFMAELFDVNKAIVKFV